jgi:tetratricopeptide (TPR) repeat protein
VLDPLSDEELGYYRPVVLSSLWPTRAGRARAVAYHATNVALHIATSVLVFAHSAGRLLATGRAAWLAALLFAIHPVHTESVAFVSGRTDLWAALLALAATLAWVPSARGAPTWRMAAAGGMAFALAALAKETALMLPVVLLAWERLRTVGRPARGAPAITRWLPAAAVAVAVVFALRAFAAGVGLGASGSLAEGTARIAADPLRALGVWSHYLRLLVIPWPLNAAYGMSEYAPSAATIAGAALILLASFAAFPKSEGRIGAVALAWTIAFLLPVSGIVAISATEISERFLYLPSVGAALVLGHWADRALGAARWRIPAAIACAALGAVFAAGTIARSAVWRDDLTLFRDIAATSPTRALAQSNLGLTYLKAGRAEEAAAAFERAIRLTPDFALAHTNLGLARQALGRHDLARQSFENAARLAPDHPGILINLGNGYLQRRRYAEAAAVYERIVRLRPGATDVQLQLGLVYAAGGDFSAAERVLSALRGAGSPHAERLAAELARRANAPNGPSATSR